jgi:hypothetical protein
MQVRFRSQTLPSNERLLGGRIGDTCYVIVDEAKFSGDQHCQEQADAVNRLVTVLGRVTLLSFFII